MNEDNFTTFDSPDKCAKWMSSEIAAQVEQRLVEMGLDKGVAEKIRTIETERDKLLKIVSQLPKTADWVVAIPGITPVYRSVCCGKKKFVIEPHTPWAIHLIEHGYSTKEAAEEAEKNIDK